jgi:hypothetical protein
VNWTRPAARADRSEGDFDVFTITGAHVIVYSEKPEADRAFLRDALGFPHVDAGGGWPIFALPPAEVAVHPAEANGAHELYLMVDDAAEFVSAMAARGVTCSPPRDLRWGLLTQLSLPGGGTLGVYEPRHARPTPAQRPGKARRRPVRKTTPSGSPRRRRQE